MITIGTLIGAIIGFKFGGFFGLIFGGFVGTQLETFINEKVLGKPTYKAQVQHSYFKALFTAIGKLAKVDGIITADEIRKCEMIMQNMRLSEQQRKQAIRYFNQGKADNFDIAPVISQFYRSSGRSYSIKQMFLEMLLEVASAEGRINFAEWKLLLNICDQLRFPQQLFAALVKMRGFNVHSKYTRSDSYSNSSQNQYQQWKPPQRQKTDSYQILGVTKTDTKVVIRRAYKKLMSQHHPDKLIAKGLPPEMIEIAKKKTQNIQAAWEDIKERRGF